MMRVLAKIATVMLLAVLGGDLAAAQNASGTLNASLVNKSGIALVFNSDASGVALGGAATSAATLNFGTVAMYMATPPAGVALTRTATDFTVSSPFDTYVTLGGVTSASYSLRATLQALPGVYTFRFDGIALSTTSTTVVAADPNYAKDVPHTLSLTVPSTAPAGVVTNTVNFVVTAN
jgi:hypothetical protein